jgi:hypothetical protein
MPALKSGDAFFEVFKGRRNSVKIVAESSINRVVFNTEVVFSLEAFTN